MTDEYKTLYTNKSGKPTMKWVLITLALVLFSLFCFALVLYLASHPLKAAEEFAMETDPQTPDFSSMTVIDERKNAFFAYLTPIIEQQNEKVLERRERILDIQEELTTKGEISNESRDYIDTMVETYRLKDDDLSVEARIDELLLRVDRIPVSMALAQAATESAWGTSRFAQTGNNFFGQWCFQEGCGTVPSRRGEEQNHEVASYDSPRDSVQSYFRNINTHRAYRSVRKMRAALREAGRDITGLELIKGLSSYSERGEDYISDLGQIIRGNQLHEKDMPEITASSHTSI